MMAFYKPDGIPWKGNSAVVPLAAIDDMRNMKHNWNWILLEDVIPTTELETMRGVMRVSFYRCKRCGAFIGQYTDICDYFRPRYCSNCGAKVVKQ